MSSSAADPIVLPIAAHIRILLDILKDELPGRGIALVVLTPGKKPQSVEMFATNMPAHAKSLLLEAAKVIELELESPRPDGGAG